MLVSHWGCGPLSPACDVCVYHDIVVCVYSWAVCHYHSDTNMMLVCVGPTVVCRQRWGHVGCDKIAWSLVRMWDTPHRRVQLVLQQQDTCFESALAHSAFCKCLIAGMRLWVMVLP
jgi:hypothetical protein